MHAMSFRKTLLLCPALLLPFLASTGSAQAIRDTQDSLVTWVDTQKAISATKAEWAAEKQIVSDLISLLQQKKEKLEASIEKLEDSTDATDTLRSELNADREALLAANESLETVLPLLESKIRTLVSKLPDPLVLEIEPLTRRLPEADTKSTLPVSQRLLTVVGILNKVDKFNTGITVTSEIRSIGDQSLEVKTLYLGLAGAYFASESSDYAGLGVPGSDGWSWQVNESIRGDVVDLIKTYEGAREATFVELPIQAL